ncbi:hypothetical protein [Gemmata sp.]|uniref:hypothetical protein n=1 Tax=Gemmata sp. TaxID=1914242 RepID=UPI003F7270A6
MRLLLSLNCALFVTVAALRADTPGNDPDQYEEKLVARATERAVKAIKSDRVLWVKELEAAFPNRVGNPTKDEDYAAWFALVAGKGDEWRRADATGGFADLFDKVVQRLELGPVPSIRRDEFQKYARRALVPGQTAGAEAHEDADRAFRVLDRDGDGVLAPAEFTTKLRDDRLRADADGNGRIDRDEYRAHFNTRATAAADVLAAKAAEAGGKPAGRTGKGGVPDWFADLDADKDGQIALSEWRKAGRAINLYLEMDLDADGLLTKEEYQRFARQKEQAEANDRRTEPPSAVKQAVK